MSGRRQGLRKSSRKGVDSSNDNAYSTCESTAESELEFNETTETSRVPHDPISLNTTSANPCSGTPTRQVTDADLDATPVQNNLMQQMHAALESSTNDVSNNQEDEDHTTVLQRTGQNPSSNGRAKKKLTKLRVQLSLAQFGLRVHSQEHDEEKRGSCHHHCCREFYCILSRVCIT